MKKSEENISSSPIRVLTTRGEEEKRRKLEQSAPIKTPNGVLNKNNYAQRTDRFEKPSNKPSMTVPDQTMSLKEMLARYVRGGEVNIKQATFSDDPDFDDPDLSKMDQFEKREMLQDLKEDIAEMREQLASAQKNRQGDSPSTQADPGPALNAGGHGEVREDRPARDGAAAPATQGNQSQQSNQQ